MTRVELPIAENHSTKVPNCSFKHLFRIYTRDCDTWPLLLGGQIGDTVVSKNDLAPRRWTGLELRYTRSYIKLCKSPT